MLCYIVNVPETVLRDPNLLSKSDLGAWQVAFQFPKCIDGKYIKYLLFTCLSSSGTNYPFSSDFHHSLLGRQKAEFCHFLTCSTLGCVLTNLTDPRIACIGTRISRPTGQTEYTRSLGPYSSALCDSQQLLCVA